jgi:hypothetical protein
MTSSSESINQQSSWIFKYKGKQYTVADSEVDLPLTCLFLTDSMCEEYRHLCHRLLRGKQQTDKERARTVCRLWQFHDKDVKLVQGWSPSEREEETIKVNSTLNLLRILGVDVE